jgi:hypothetical protein
MSETTELLSAVHEIRDLVRLMAEPQIAARDQKLRDELVRIVGKSEPKAKAVFLMDGSHTQAVIHAQTKFNQGHLSTLVKQLGASKLLTGPDPKQPKLAISIPADFFEKARSLK